jgi:hypothetical protein
MPGSEEQQTRRLVLPLEHYDNHSAPVDRRAVYATNIVGLGRVELVVTIAAWNTLGRKAELVLDVVEDSDARQ